MKFPFYTLLSLLPAVLWAAPEQSGLADTPIAEHRSQLLDLAFSAASAMPVQPHLKNRSRSQKEVVDACLELGQFRTAETHIRRIGNWQKGLAYADLAYRCASQSATVDVEPFLVKAEGLAKLTEDWRRDRIRVRVAQTRQLLADPDRKELPPVDPNSPESGKLLAGESFAEKLEALKKIQKSGTFEEVRNSLWTAVRMYDTQYSDQEKRTEIAAVVDGGLDPMPYFVRIELVLAMARAAAGHDDAEQALKQVSQARELFASVEWKPQQYVKRKAHLLAVSYQVGDRDRAAKEAKDLLGYYQANREKIVNMFRGEALRPLAETLYLTGARQLAFETYELALAEAVENPNSRPRAQDLCSTACSMALADIEPTAELWQRLKKVETMLGKPW